MSCSVPGCSNCRRFKPENVSFHTFPRGGLLLKTWLTMLGKNPKTWKWTKNKFVCSRHFHREDFIFIGSKRLLKNNIVPRLNGVNGLSTVIEPSTSEEVEDDPVTRKLSKSEVTNHLTQTDTFLCAWNSPEIHECDQCEFQTFMKVSLHNHVKVFHEDKEPSLDLRRSLENYQCQNCYFETSSVLLLIKHDEICEQE